MFGIRKKIKSTIKQILHLEEDNIPQSTVVEPEVAPQKETVQESVAVPPQSTSTNAEEVKDEGIKEGSKSEPEQASIESQSPAEAPATPRVIKAAESTQHTGKELTLEAVQEILDDDIRPALQSDGGDITLIKIEDNNIYVKLVGACSTCPSSVATMGMFVENLLKEEFPSLENIIEVHDDEPIDAQG